jgi:fucose permease
MPQRRIDLLSLTTFVVLGLPDGMLGTVWPAMRRSFDVPVGDLGVILLIQTVGSVAVTGVVSPLMRRIGVGTLLGASAILAAAASGGYSMAPALAVVLPVAVLFGVANSSVDASLNAVVALSGRGRLLNLLHGAYGLGTAIGPLLVTGALLLGSWRAAYVVLVGVELALACQWFLHRRSGWEAPRAAQDRDGAATRTRSLRLAPVPQVVAGVGLFFVYTGLEVAAGQWETVFDRDHLHMSAAAAGIATFTYWGALTVVRIALALVPRPLARDLIVRVGGGLSVAATAAIWLVPVVAVKVAAFTVLGGALAGIFPALIALTPDRVGSERAASVIAWQMGAAAAGAAGISAIVGLLVDAFSLAVLGPALTVLAVVFAVGSAVPERLSRAAEAAA